MFTGICESLTVSWLTALTHLWRAENKLVQMAAARRVGIAIPRTHVVSHREQLPAQLGNEVVIKPLGTAVFTNDAGEAQVVFANTVAVDDPALDYLGTAPFLIQERLDAAQHLRIVTVGAHAWICSLDAPIELDWRRNDEAHQSFAATEDHPLVAHQAVELARELNVGYSSQDWIVTKTGVASFLDLNPAGQWLFLPTPVASAVTAALAMWLAETTA